ncbi:MAG: hypothetical protein Q8O30_03850 [Candidatus Omnitrophota bacterium]|nr:hypothetical protein [Candidatus Omnitrophota bacterium]
MKKALAFVLCCIIVFGWSGIQAKDRFSIEELRQQFRELISKEKSQKLFEEADLVFEGTPTKVEFPQKGMIVNAKGLESLDESHFVVFFKVEKVIKGKYENEVFSIIVHSPTISFKIAPEEYA